MKKVVVSILVIVAFIIGCKTANSNNEKKLALNFEPKSNSTVSGTATFIEKNGKVIFEAKLSGLKPGVHAIHIHEKSDCSSADGSSAGGHWNPTFKKHGKWGEGEYHKGDIGNFTADENGNSLAGMGEIIMAKNRSGSLDSVWLKFIGKFTKYCDLDFQPFGGAGEVSALMGV